MNNVVILISTFADMENTDNGKNANNSELITETSSESNSESDDEENVTDSSDDCASNESPENAEEEIDERKAHVTNLLRKVAGYKKELDSFTSLRGTKQQAEFLSTKGLQYKKCILQICLQVFRMKIKVKNEDIKLFSNYQQLLTDNLSNVNVCRLKSVEVDAKLSNMTKAENGLLLKTLVKYRNKL